MASFRPCWVTATYRTFNGNKMLRLRNGFSRVQAGGTLFLSLLINVGRSQKTKFAKGGLLSKGNKNPCFDNGDIVRLSNDV